MTDPLTGLLNRGAIEAAARTALENQARSGRPVAFGLIDVDDFRAINRRYLIPGGDAALVGLAKTLAATLRPLDRLGRIGGEEFLLVAPDTDEQAAFALAERIRTDVAQAQIRYQGERIPVTVRVGFAVARGGGAITYDQLLHAAAQAVGSGRGGPPRE